MYEENSGVYGSRFGAIKSVGELKGHGKGQGVVSAVKVVDGGYGSGIEVMNPQGPYLVSEPVAEVEEALDAYHIAEF